MRSRFRRKPPPEPVTEPVTKIAPSKPTVPPRKGWVVGITALMIALLGVLVLGIGWFTLYR
jgi:hypothetical protein